MFPRGDLNRIWLVIGAIDNLESATLVNIVKATGMPKPTINDILKKLLNGQVPSVIIVKNEAIYSIKEWGDFREEITKLFQNSTCKDG
tara:strand:+ start:516 stop:779 length:264 start_codon:yes stop_codon:yes gene_type:complete